MSVRVVQPTTVFECSMCPTTLVANWRDLADNGWTCNHAGPDYAPIILCEPCALELAATREFGSLGA